MALGRIVIEPVLDHVGNHVFRLTSVADRPPDIGSGVVELVHFLSRLAEDNVASANHCKNCIDFRR